MYSWPWCGSGRKNCPECGGGDWARRESGPFHDGSGTAAPGPQEWAAKRRRKKQKQKQRAG